MIIAIDETGDFSPKSNKYHFFSAVHIANSENKDDLICRRFYNWESSLPASLKNHNGEIKSARLNELQLCGFVDEVLIPEPKIRISSISFIPVENPWRIINKHKFIPQLGINEGIFLFSKLNNSEMVKFIKDFSFWFRKLNYVGFIKLLLLGNIIYKSFRNTVGISIALAIEDELLDIKIKIDELFIKGNEPHLFWHEMLRNQIYNESKNNPLPFSTEWNESEHPFVKKYTRNGIIDFNDLFSRNCSFAKSHQSFEIRIADTVNTIISKYFNNNQYKSLYSKIKSLMIPQGQIDCIKFKDFNVDEMVGKSIYNPWLNLKDFAIRDSSK